MDVLWCYSVVAEDRVELIQLESDRKMGAAINSSLLFVICDLRLSRY